MFSVIHRYKRKKEQLSRIKDIFLFLCQVLRLGPEYACKFFFYLLSILGKSEEEHEKILLGEIFVANFTFI